MTRAKIQRLFAIAVLGTLLSNTAFAAKCDEAVTLPMEKARKYFTDPRLADPNSVVAPIRGRQPLTTDALLEAYSNGIFPWGSDRAGIPDWYSPRERAIFFLDQVQPSKSMKKVLKNNKFRVTFDQDFEGVIRACATSTRKDGDEILTESGWITSRFVEEYIKLHKLGVAHSVEVWNEKGELVGGSYGIHLNGVFAGESMFSRESNASKVAFYHLVDRLRAKGIKWIDSQVLNDHTESLGAQEVHRLDYLKLLREAQTANIPY